MDFGHNCKEYSDDNREFHCYTILDKDGQDDKILRLDAEEYEIIVKYCPFCGLSANDIRDQ